MMVLSCRCPPIAFLFLLFGSTFCMVAAGQERPPSPPPNEDINECLSDPCMNGGTCTNTVGSYFCTCAPGYTGVNCDVAECPCWTTAVLATLPYPSGVDLMTCWKDHNGTGTVNVDEWRIKFADDSGELVVATIEDNGVAGMTCNLYQEICDPDCVTVTNKFRNIDDTDTFQACELQVQESGLARDFDCFYNCDQNPCQNGGTCVDDSHGRYTCDCSGGWSGTNCDEDTAGPTSLPTAGPTSLPSAGPSPVPTAPPTVSPPVRRKTFHPVTPPIATEVDPPTPNSVDPPTPNSVGPPAPPNPVDPPVETVTETCLLRLFGVCTCFSERTEVQVFRAGTTPMKDLKVGDRVLTDEGYSTVYSFGHKLTKGSTSYLQVLTDRMYMKHPLEISQEHLIFKHAEDPKARKVVPAGDLKVGDHLVTENGLPAKIIAISTVVREGAYSPLTTKGKLLVNGVLASSYVTRSWVKDSFSGDTLHAFQHGSVVPYRFFCLLFGCENELYDEETGFSPWVHFWYGVEQWQLQLSKNGRLAFFFFLVIPSIMATLLGKLLIFPTYLAIVHMAAAVLGYVVWNKLKKRNVLKTNEMKPNGKVS